MKTRRIPLTRGLFAIIDATDYQRIAAHKWYANKCGSRFYARRSTPRTRLCPRKKVPMHRDILNFPLERIDHSNRNTLDNRRCNLRLATSSQDSANRRRATNNRSGIKGVCYEQRKRRWRALIQCLGRRHHLGYFSDLADAARAYQQAAKEFFKEFARP